MALHVMIVWICFYPCVGNHQYEDIFLDPGTGGMCSLGPRLNTTSIAFLGRAQFWLLYMVTCRIHTFAWTNYRSPTRFDITLAFNDPRLVKTRYIRKETHRRQSQVFR
ncbi:hypothetical protein F5888DRAFT_1723219 [Russula emetica]|nr:hypothetical protein F5888DRAFT_1723219 [Russula emetica]